MKVVAPYNMPFLIRKFLSGAIWNVPGQDQTVYLTFDDGPIPGLTEYVLDILDQYNAQATFFCVGDNVKKHPGLFKRINDSGHAVGNHTYNHLNGWMTGTKKYIENVNRCTVEMQRVVPGLVTRLLRPPHGRITPVQVHHLKQQYQIVMWTVLTNDFNITHSAERSIKAVKNHVRGGSIVVFHDNLKAEMKLKVMLPAILEFLVQSGYRFKVLS